VEELRISSLEEVLASKTAEECTQVVTIRGLGTLKLRAYSLREYYEMQRAAREGDDFDEDRWEALVIQHGVAEPALTYDQAARLALRPAHLVQKLIAEIGRLSGLDISAMLGKEAIDRAEASFPEGSAEVSDLQSGGPETDDGEAAPG